MTLETRTQSYAALVAVFAVILVTTPAGGQVTPTGACCLPTGCQDNHTATSCQSAGGAYQGNFTACSGVTCPTCQGSCTNQSPTGCWCDSNCFGFGDCCYDVCHHCAGVFPTQCAGNFCSNAQPVGEGTFGPVNMTYRTASGVNGSCGTIPRDHWFTYTASCTGTATASVCNNDDVSPFGNVGLSVFDACGGAELACSQSNNCLYGALVSWPVLAGQTYRVRLSAVGSGIFVNFECDGTPPGDDCKTAEPVGDGVIGPLSMDGYTPSGDTDSCGTVPQDRWFDYTPSCTGTATATICHTDDVFPFANVALSAFDACSGTELACSSTPPTGCLQGAKITWWVTEGQTYRVRLSASGFGIFVNFECEPVPGCGDAEAGGCFAANNTPFCDDPICCQTVCAQDPFCCAVAWDGVCVAQAEYLCINEPASVVLAYWDFNDETLDVTLGQGTMTHNFVPANVTYFTGTDVGALQAGITPNRAVALQNGTGGVNNGASLQFAFDTTGHHNLVMTFASQRSATGFNSNQVAWSADGGAIWTNHGAPYTPVTSFAATGLLVFDFQSITQLNDNPDVVIRITFDGGDPSSAQGNNRLDNVLFTADLIAVGTGGTAGTITPGVGLHGLFEMEVVYSDGAIIQGELCCGLTELPETVTARFVLDMFDGIGTTPGLHAGPLNAVAFSMSFGGLNWNVVGQNSMLLMDATFDAVGPDNVIVTDLIWVGPRLEDILFPGGWDVPLNFPLTIRGIDTATGEVLHEYQYTTSTQTVTPTNCPAVGCCAGHCGGVSFVGCACDAGCFDRGDCCEDVCLSCGLPADMNGDGVIDGLDIQPFVEALLGNPDTGRTAASAVPEWLVMSEDGPSPRQSHAMAYDAARQRVVLFGGFDGSNRGDTWEWDGAVWTQVADTGPSPRLVHAMAYDAGRARIVLFGGNDGSPRGDTWEWDGSVWTEVATTGPNPRTGHAMAYDAARERVVLFGGVSGVTRFDDTWEWNGNALAWTLIHMGGPSPRSNHAIAYDAARERVVLFGGFDTSGRLDDTWEWDGSGWTQIFLGGPNPRLAHAMAYDAARGRIVLFGGNTSFGSVDDTWEWDGSSWTEVVAAGPSPRERHALAYDVARQRVVLFGGFTGSSRLGDTWHYGADKTPCLPGDLNGDNVVDEVDVALFVSALLGTELRKSERSSR